MAGIAETLDLAGLSSWAAHTSAELSGLSFRAPLTEAKGIVVEDVRSNFQGSHAPDGSPWASLAHPRPRGGTKPLQDTGLLSASFGGGQGHVETLTDRELTVGTALEQARIHQDGGTIVPRSARLLAIPLTVEAQRVPGPRQFPRDLFALPRQGKPPLLAERVFAGRGKRVRPQLVIHFALASSVTIPARPYAGYSTRALARIDDVFGDFLAHKAI